MSKLEQLIQKLCPDGVKYKKLGELGSFYGGLSGKSKTDFSDGNAKFITYMNVYSNPELKIDIIDRVRISEGEKQNSVHLGDVLFTGSSETPDECGMSSVLTQEINELLYLNSFCFGFRFIDVSLVLPDFSKHLFRSENLRRQIGKTASGVTRFNVSKSKMEQVVVPLPPLPVQQEIVRILDTFTELTAELTARKKQYEYYRDKLLLHDDEVSSAKLTEICEISRGRVISKEYLRDNSGEYPVYSSQTLNNGIFGFIDSYDYEDESITWTTDGANAGSVFYHVNEKFSITNVCGLLRIKNKSEINAKFVYYYLQKYAKGYVSSGMGNPKLMSNVMGQVTLPLPPIHKQNRIVSILDRFDALCNDLTSGLPAEIEARKKQYEHYRDKLLTFKEKPV